MDFLVKIAAKRDKVVNSRNHDGMSHLDSPQASLLPLAQLRTFLTQFAATPESHALLFSGTSVTQQDVAAADFELTPAIMWRVCENVRLAFGPAWYLGVPALWGTDLHSELDFAMKTAPTLRAALEISVQYGMVRWPIAQSKLDIGKAFARFSAIRADVVPLPDWQMIGIIAGLNTQWLLEHAFPGVIEHCRAEFQGNPPLPEGKMGNYFHLPVRWNMPTHSIIIPSALLDTPSAMADARSSNACVEILRQKFVPIRRTTAARVANVLGDVSNGRMRGADVASSIGVSYRTLGRQLAAEGTSFEELRDQSLRTRAEQLMRNTQLGVVEIVEQLGYADQTAFLRAFKRWFGCTLTEARQTFAAADAIEMS